MEQYILKSALVAEIKKRLHKYEKEYERLAHYEIWITAKEIEPKIKELKNLLSFLDTLEVIDPYEQCVQYDSIKSGIQAQAETYSFNIESELYNQQTTKEGQKLWRKEIEQAFVIGGEVGVELARDPRYKENLEAKEEQEEPVSNPTPNEKMSVERWKEACKASAEWKEKQMMKDAIDAKIGSFVDGTIYDVDFNIDSDLKQDDKIKVIIIKSE